MELFRNGREWWRLRSEFQKGLSSPGHIRQFLCNSDAITKEFVSQMKPRPHPTQDSDDFLPELSRLNLECKYIHPFIHRFDLNLLLFHFQYLGRSGLLFSF